MVQRKKHRGRPSIAEKPAFIAKVASIVEEGNFPLQAVILAGATRDQYYRWRNDYMRKGSKSRYAKLFSTIEKMEARHARNALDIVTRFSKYDPVSARFILTKRHKQWDAPTQVELSGKDSGPIQVETILDSFLSKLDEYENKLAPKRRKKKKIMAGPAIISSPSSGKRSKTNRTANLTISSHKKVKRQLSYMERLARLPYDSRKRLLSKFSETELEFLMNTWELWRRPDQKFTNDSWDIGIVEAGRGYGKTRVGAEQVKAWVEDSSEKHIPIALIGRTAADVRDTMINDPTSGLMNIWPNSKRPIYNPSNRKITFYNGAVAFTYSDEEPDQLAGKQHRKAWLDEGALFKKLDRTFYMLMFGLRLGKHPQVIVTTTPRRKRSYKSIFHSKHSKYSAYSIARINGSSYDNASNLSEKFIDTVIKPYEGTRLGLQEIYGKYVTGSAGALWWEDLLDNYRVDNLKLNQLARIVVGVDPAVTYNEDSNSTGIVVVGKGYDGHGYVLADYTVKAPPNTKVIDGIVVKGWAEYVAEAYDTFQADTVVGEVNNGGDLVEAVATELNRQGPDGNSSLALNFKSVRASRGKRTRAEPVAMLYEKGLIHHIGCNDLENLEEQLCTWEPGDESPDSMDALVWACYELFLAPGCDFHVLANSNNWKPLFSGK